MRVALCMEGGGAKGAYEAGVVKALYDNGIKDYVSIAGTSIGAINGYFIATGNMEKLAYIWNNVEENLGGTNIQIEDNKVNNDNLIKGLYLLEEGNRKGIPLHINYVKVHNKCIEEKIVETSKMDRDECLEYIKYSSLLPFNPQKQKGFKEGFIEDVLEGAYEGECLDGGMCRSLIVEPVFEEKPDKVVVISTLNDYKLPKELVEKYGKDTFIVARPKYKFEPGATLNLNMEFCRKIFSDGYEIGQELVKEFRC